ncbi:hypothetical protein GQ42DRAFT_160236 [Ramicandelaber brevisporus]|nr:hypothetical protein GQ42DRAFT_160236 [Ramicandelaber brevisporus]
MSTRAGHVPPSLQTRSLSFVFVIVASTVHLASLTHQQLCSATFLLSKPILSSFFLAMTRQRNAPGAAASKDPIAAVASRLIEMLNSPEHIAKTVLIAKYFADAPDIVEARVKDIDASGCDIVYKEREKVSPLAGLPGADMMDQMTEHTAAQFAKDGKPREFRIAFPDKQKSAKDVVNLWNEMWMLSQKLDEATATAGGAIEDVQFVAPNPFLSLIIIGGVSLLLYVLYHPNPHPLAMQVGDVFSTQTKKLILIGTIILHAIELAIGLMFCIVTRMLLQEDRAKLSWFTVIKYILAITVVGYPALSNLFHAINKATVPEDIDEITAAAAADANADVNNESRKDQ